MHFSVSLRVFEIRKTKLSIHGTTIFALFLQVEPFYIPRIFNKIKVKQPTAMHNNAKSLIKPELSSVARCVFSSPGGKYIIRKVIRLCTVQQYGHTVAQLAETLRYKS
jgi:hypothetical protein